MKNACKISIIIPTYNEAASIAKLLNHLRENDKGGHAEIIITDGNSTDDTVTIAAKTGVSIVVAPNKGRASQMNYGAMFATTNVLYFLHADSLPPVNYAENILSEINNGYSMGCFRLRFDNANWFLKTNAWFTRYDCNAFRFGDQSLFVRKDIFTKAGGFNEKLILMEDQEIIHRLKRYGKFKVMSQMITTSSRKYLLNGTFKLQAIFYLIYLLYKTGVPQNKLIHLYRKLIRQDKV